MSDNIIIEFNKRFANGEQDIYLHGNDVIMKDTQTYYSDDLIYIVFSDSAVNPGKPEDFRELLPGPDVESVPRPAGVACHGLGVLRSERGHQAGIHPAGKGYPDFLSFACFADGFFNRPSECFVFRQMISSGIWGSHPRAV